MPDSKKKKKGEILNERLLCANLGRLALHSSHTAAPDCRGTWAGHPTAVDRGANTFGGR